MPEHGGVFDAGIACCNRSSRGPIRGWCATLRRGWLGCWASSRLRCAATSWAAAGSPLRRRWALALSTLLRRDLQQSQGRARRGHLTFVLWATLLLVKAMGVCRTPLQPRPEHALRAALLLGVLIGVATAVRVNAVTWYGVLGAAPGGWWVAHGVDDWREQRVWSGAGVRQTLVAGRWWSARCS